MEPIPVVESIPNVVPIPAVELVPIVDPIPTQLLLFQFQIQLHQKMESQQHYYVLFARHLERNKQDKR